MYQNKLMLCAVHLFHATVMMAILTILFAAGLALAEVGPDTLNLNEPNSDTFKELYHAVVSGNWWLAMGPAVTALVFFLKKYDVKIPKVGPAIDSFLDKPVVSFALPFLVSAVGGFGTAMATGLPLVSALGAAGKVAMAAVVTYIGLKKAAESMKPAVDAGAAAAKDPGSTLNL